MIALTLTIISIFILIGIIIILDRARNKDINKLRKENSELKSAKRSLETIYGFAVENLTPFLNDMGEYDPKEFRQMGQPIDYIYFGDKQIEFIEVKSGNSKLSQKQRKIKDQIKNNKVIFKELRIKR